MSTKVVGMRVMRGPDWEWGDQDGGKGSYGTVVDESSVREGWVDVKWDNSSSDAKKKKTVALTLGGNH